MKKNILKMIIAGVFVFAMVFNYTMNTSSQITKVNTNLLSVGQEAEAICVEYYEGMYACCFNGNNGCTNAVNGEHYGPYYY